MSALDSLDRLIADAKAAYATGIVHPVRRQFFRRGDYGEFVCCAMVAAHIHVVGKDQLEFNQDGGYTTPPTVVRKWVEDHYGLSEDAVSGFEVGFDLDEVVLEGVDDREGLCTAYSVGRDLGVQLVGNKLWGREQHGRGEAEGVHHLAYRLGRPGTESFDGRG